MRRIAFALALAAALLLPGQAAAKALPATYVTVNADGSVTFSAPDWGVPRNVDYDNADYAQGSFQNMSFVYPASNTYTFAVGTIGWQAVTSCTAAAPCYAYFVAHRGGSWYIATAQSEAFIYP